MQNRTAESELDSAPETRLARLWRQGLSSSVDAAVASIEQLDEGIQAAALL